MLSGFGLILCACSVSSPLAVRSIASDGLAPEAQIAITLPDDGSAPLTHQFAKALIAALETSGMEISPDGRLIADYAVSVSPAQIGLREAGGTTEVPTNQPEWIAEPRPRKRFDECDAQQLRGTLLLIDRSTGQTLYRGQGAATECEFGEDKIRELAVKLVADLAARR
ncbi:hypothetical protein [Qipengyuania sp. ASV99]|uniref:hypothetical protein n=1 Tax=Qipengyuania sp. ASV99 TaxID=3399681 RepID=UPI003A4C7A8A